MKANPALPYGGTGIDSKFDRYRLFQQCEYAIPTIQVDRDIPRSKLEQALADNKLTFPVIAKPDCGSFSIGVHRFDDLDELSRFFTLRKDVYLIQPYIAAPFEYAIYYFRLPQEESGKVVDLTARILPSVTGNGQHSVAQLIDSRSEWDVTVANKIKRKYRGDLNRILAAGETVMLSIAARGSEGALFKDNRNLITAELEQSINRITAGTGFYVGKFDIKVNSVRELQKGRGFKILEVNGLASEMNFLYDLKCCYGTALKEIAQQMNRVFRIAHQNRGIKSSVRTLDIVQGFSRLRQRYRSLVTTNIGAS